LISAKLFYYYR